MHCFYDFCPITRPIHLLHITFWIVFDPVQYKWTPERVNVGWSGFLAPRPPPAAALEMVIQKVEASPCPPNAPILPHLAGRLLQLLLQLFGATLKVVDAGQDKCALLLQKGGLLTGLGTVGLLVLRRVWCLTK